MTSDLGNVPCHESYFVEIDGIVKFEYRVFVRALTACLRLKHDFPNSTIKLRDADEPEITTTGCSAPFAAPRDCLIAAGRGKNRDRGS